MKNIFCILFSLIYGHESSKNDLIGLFGFRSTDRNGAAQTADYYADSIMTDDTLYQSVFLNDAENVPAKTKIQRFKPYSRLLDQLRRVFV